MQRCAVALVLCLSFAVSIHAQTESLWTTSTVPANTTGNDSSSVELGLRFSSNVAGSVTGARIYCASNSSGTHTVHLWNSTGTSLGTVTLPACSGWTAVNFASSIAVTAGSTYTISYRVPAETRRSSQVLLPAGRMSFLAIREQTDTHTEPV